jgi:hypothetical protein
MFSWKISGGFLHGTIFTRQQEPHRHFFTTLVETSGYAAPGTKF